MEVPMSGAETRKVTFREITQQIEASRLKDLQEERVYGEAERQDVYREMWTVLSLIYPDDHQGETRLGVVSWRLVELGLVPEEIAEQIGQKRERRGQTPGDLKRGDEPENWVVIDRIENGFKITKTYMAEYTPIPEGPDFPRFDFEIREVAVLTFDGKQGRYDFSQKTNKPKPGEKPPVDRGVHIHFGGYRWVATNPDREREQYEEEDISTRNLVRTLVLLIEGISPGSPKSSLIC